MALSGQLCLAKYWYTSMTNCPDVVCSMHNAVVKLRSDGTATVRCHFELRGNVVLSVLNASSGPGVNDRPALTEGEGEGQGGAAADPEFEESLERYLQAKRAVRNALCLKRRRVRKLKVNATEESRSKEQQAGVEEEQEEQKAAPERLIPVSISTERDARTLPEMRSYVTPSILAHALDRLGRDNTLTSGQMDSAMHSLLCRPPAEARQFEPGAGGGRFDMQVCEQGQVVLTACCDVLCSYDLEFNAENKVQSLVVNLMK